MKKILFLLSFGLITTLTTVGQSSITVKVPTTAPIDTAHKFLNSITSITDSLVYYIGSERVAIPIGLTKYYTMQQADNLLAGKVNNADTANMLQNYQVKGTAYIKQQSDSITSQLRSEINTAAAGSGVVTFNNRSLNVVPLQTDYAAFYKSLDYVPDWSELTNKPTFAPVATTGSYTDLTNKPTIPTNNTQLTNGQNYATLNSPTFTGVVNGISKAMIGLSNVDNTSDLNKPISTITQAALNTKVSDTDVVHMFRNESIPSDKTFTGLITLPTTTNIKKINGNSLIGAGDISVRNADSLLGHPGTYYAPVSSVPTNNTQLTNGEQYTTSTQVNDSLTKKVNITDTLNMLNPYALKNKVAADSLLLQTAINTKQQQLVSGTNIKTLNGQSLLDTGNITIIGSNDVDSLNGQPGTYYAPQTSLASKLNSTDTTVFNRYTNTYKKQQTDSIAAGLFVSQSFDTTSRILTMIRKDGSTSSVVIPRGSNTGVATLSNNRTNNLVSVTGDNGTTTTFSVTDADSATRASKTYVDSLTTIKQNIIPNLSDTSKYAKKTDSVNVALLNGGKIDTSHLPVQNITISHEGAGIQLLYGSDSDTLHSKNIQAGTNVTLTQNSDSSITISSSGGGTTQVTYDSLAIATAGQAAFTFPSVPATKSDFEISVWGIIEDPALYTVSGNVVTFLTGLSAGDKVLYHRIK